ncbi:MAG: hypothetical protein ACOCRK_06925 [bacterium]
MGNFNYDEVSRISGNAFENWFSRLMKKKYPNRYIQTRALGSKGDLKVDGVLDNTICFACYGAENSQNFNKYCTGKFRKDLMGFNNIKNSKWSTINKWIFVTNSQHENLPAKIVSQKNSLIKRLNITFECNIWTLYDIDRNVYKKQVISPSNEKINELTNKLTSFLIYYKNFRIQLQESGYESNFYNKLNKEAEIFGLEDHKNVLIDYDKMFSDLTYCIHENILFLRTIGLQNKIDEFLQRFKLIHSSEIYFSFSYSFSKIIEITLEEEVDFINSIIDEILNNI